MKLFCRCHACIVWSSCVLYLVRARTRLGSGCFLTAVQLCAMCLACRCADRLYAVKIISIDHSPSIEQLQHETRFLKACRECEYIVGYLAAFEVPPDVNPTVWLLMEYCEGGSVRDLIHSQQVTDQNAGCVRSCVVEWKSVKNLPLFTATGDAPHSPSLASGESL